MAEHVVVGAFGDPHQRLRIRVVVDDRATLDVSHCRMRGVDTAVDDGDLDALPRPLPSTPSRG